VLGQVVLACALEALPRRALRGACPLHGNDALALENGGAADRLRKMTPAPRPREASHIRFSVVAETIARTGYTASSFGY
jgi:hypothetical protein